MSRPPTTIPLHLPPLRYAVGIVITGGIGGFAAWMSLQETLVRPGMDLKALAIARRCMSIDRVAGVWPIPAVAAIFLGAIALFFLAALILPRRSPFALTMNEDGISWPRIAPWSAPRRLAWSELTSVGMNSAGDHLVFLTSQARYVMPAWWLPPTMRAADVLRAADAWRAPAADVAKA